MYRPQNVAPAAPTAPAAPVAPAAPAPKPEAPAGNMMTQGVSAKKKGKGAILGMVFLGILAVAGISFGVWEMMSANQQKKELNSQVTTLKQQISQLSENQNNAVGDNSDEMADSYSNPIIKSSNSDNIFRPSYKIVVTDVSKQPDSQMHLTVDVEDGKISACWFDSVNCTINGIEGNIYKIEKIYMGNGITDEKIGFLMTDGTVWYAPIYEENGAVKTELTAKKANINGFVKDIIFINNCSNVTMYCNGSTVFVLGDNSILEYEESMFQS